MSDETPTTKLDGDPLTVEQLQGIDIFEGIPERRLARLVDSIVRRRFKAGEAICREGEGGLTAFFLLEGSAEVFISPRGRDGVGAAKRKRGGLIAAIGRMFGQEAGAAAPRRSEDHLVFLDDAPVELKYGSLTATIEANNIFGEMSCLNRAPRSATIVAKTDCTALEFLRVVYKELEKSKPFKEKMDAEYRKRALGGHLRNIPIFASLDDGGFDRLREEVELATYEPGQTIFSQGDEADAMYIVRFGRVRVSKRAPGGERTLAYMKKGDFFGEIGLLEGAPRSATCAAYDHPAKVRMVMQRDAGRVDLVRIRREQFDWLVERYPDVKRRLQATAQKRLEAERVEAVSLSVRAPSARAERLGLFQGQNLMVIDLERCTRCDQCVSACVAAHDDGVSRLLREGPRFDKYLVPSSCRMCQDPVCLIPCPVSAIRRDPVAFNIVIEDWCIGCEQCADYCPYDSIQMHKVEDLEGHHASEEVKRQAVVCDQCSSSPRGPACVYACPHDAAKRMSGAEFLKLGDFDEAGAAIGGGGDAGHQAVPAAVVAAAPAEDEADTDE